MPISSSKLVRGFHPSFSRASVASPTSGMGVERADELRVRDDELIGIQPHMPEGDMGELANGMAYPACDDVVASGVLLQQAVPPGRLRA